MPRRDGTGLAGTCGCADLKDGGYGYRFSGNRQKCCIIYNAMGIRQRQRAGFSEIAVDSAYEKDALMEQKRALENRLNEVNNRLNSAQPG